nr:uncharacterized protein LOC109168531 [Ipomoea batatas]
MDPPLPAMAASLVDAQPLTASASAAKIRLMCSYGGHIAHRPLCKSLCYVGGETRVVAVDRRNTAASLSPLIAHLSRVLYNSRPFHLKYQLPNEELDSLVSVTTDEDFQNMLEEYDRISSSASAATPSRIRLFLFPDSQGSALLDQKADSWFSDALNNSTIVRKGQSTDSCTPRGLMGLDTVIGSDLLSVEGQAECLSSSGGGGGDAKHGLELGGLLQESLVLETSSSFGSTNSSISMSNLPAIGVHGDETGFNLLEKRLRVPSSASLESDISVGSVGFQSKPSTYQEPFIQVVSGATSCTTEPESPISNASNLFQAQKMVQVPSYQVPQQSDGKGQHHGVQYVHGGPYYIPQYTTTPLPLSSCYPVYQVPVQQSPYTLSQQYPIYFVPVHPTPSINMSMQCSVNDTATISPNRPILHPQGHVIPPPTAQKDFPSAQQVPDSSAKVYGTIPISTVPVSAPSTQGQQQFVSHLEAQFSSQPVSSTSVSVTNYSDEFDDDLSYAQIYKSQPPAPAFISQCQTITKGQQYSYKSPQCSNT